MLVGTEDGADLAGRCFVMQDSVLYVSWFACAMAARAAAKRESRNMTKLLKADSLCCACDGN